MKHIKQRSYSAKGQRSPNRTLHYTLCGLGVLIAGLIVTAVAMITLNKSPKQLVARPLEYKDVNASVKRSFPLYWYNVVCSTSNVPLIPTLSSVEDTIVRNNAIFLRSQANFKFHLQSFSTLQVVDCQQLSQSSDTKTWSSFLRREGLQRLSSDLNVTFPLGLPPGRGVLVFSVDMNAETKFRGFASVGYPFVFLNRTETEVPSNVLAHELGHTLGLRHPFNDQFGRVLDLPRICMNETERTKALDECPESLSTCGEDVEELNNVMDYLPEKCNRRYVFSEEQVKVMQKSLF